MNQAWNQEEFTQQLFSLEKYYHIHHPFNVSMNKGLLNREQIQAWVANRFYYQVNIPIKDAAILSNCHDINIRRQWIKRITDHDGGHGNPGGIEAWTRLGEACGVSREELWSMKRVLPGVRFAVDAYTNFAKKAPWQDAVCASLTELFAPKIHQERLANWPEHYPWVHTDGLQYFRNRITEAREDVKLATKVVLEHYKTREQQEQAIAIVKFKLDILWALSDAIYLAFVGMTQEKTEAHHECGTHQS